MDAGEVRKRMLAQFGIRIEPEMGMYVLRQLESPSAGDSFPVMGGDARTGSPVRRLIPFAAFSIASPSSSPSS